MLFIYTYVTTQLIQNEKKKLTEISENCFFLDGLFDIRTFIVRCHKTAWCQNEDANGLNLTNPQINKYGHLQPLNNGD